MQSSWKSFGTILAVGVAMAVLAGSATPAGAAEACGSELIGSGSSLQAAAQTEVWSSGWKASECKAKPTIKYVTTSNGSALEQWGASKGVLGGATGLEKPFPMFIATDLAPEGLASTEGTQMSNMVKGGGVLKYAFPNEVVTVPVAQVAVAVVISLPKGCKAEGTTPQVKSKVLGEVWEKGTLAFKSIVSGVKLTGKACEEVKKELASLQPLLEARETSSGATAGFKRYLAQVAPGSEFKSLTTTAEKSANTTWPKTLPTGLPEEKGNTSDLALAQKVAKTGGSVGYTDLADAIAAGFTAKPAEITKEAGYQSFFVQIQSNAKEAAKPEYASPESEKGANCKQAKYKGAPAEVESNADWSQAIDSNVEGGKGEDYPICTLTYDVLWFWQSAPEAEGKLLYNEEEENATYDYIRYIVKKEGESGGQGKGLEEKHYAKLTEEVQESAAAGLGIREEAPGTRAVPWPTVTAEPGEGPGSGRPWVATVGDSFTSGEAGRWAGNSNVRERLVDALGKTAYFDSPEHTEEEHVPCHRSASAEAYINITSAIGEVAAVNFACSGAKTASFTEPTGIFVPGLDEAIGGEGVKGQALLLKEFAEKHNVKMVVVSISGNNFGFAEIIRECVRAYMEFKTCSTNETVEAHVKAGSVRTVVGETETGIKNIREAMTKAGYNENMYTILVQDYPSLIPEVSTAFRYVEGNFFVNRWIRQSQGGCGFRNVDARWANATVISRVNEAVHQAAVSLGFANVRFMNLRNTLRERRLCETDLRLVGAGQAWTDAGAVDETEWVDQIKTDPALFQDVNVGNFGTHTQVFPKYLIQEAMHPNYWAQLAVRNCLRHFYDAGVVFDHGGACVRAANGLTEGGEPFMDILPSRGFVSHGAGEAKSPNQMFSLGETTIKCGEGIFLWGLSGVSSSLELKPEYQKCKANSGASEAAAKVTTKGCGYVLREPPSSESFEGWLSLAKGCVLEITASFSPECRMKIEGPQELEGMRLKDLNTGETSLEGEIGLQVPGIAFTSEGEGCATVGVPSEGSGEYVAEIPEKGVISEESGTELWRERPNGEAGSGVYISQGAPEKIKSKGGESKLVSKLAGEALPVTCAESKGAGILYDGSLAGQAKLLVSLEKCTTKISHCTVTEPISFPVNLRLTWKWNGMKASLSQGKQQISGQKPTVLLSHNEIAAGMPKAEEELATVKFKKDGVGICLLEGVFTLKGYEAAEVEPQSIEQFSKEPKLKFTPGKHLEHYWNGTEQVGIETTLKLGSEPAELTSSDTITPITTPGGKEQEVGIFEN